MVDEVCLPFRAARGNRRWPAREHEAGSRHAGFERAAALRDKLIAVESVMASGEQTAISTVQEDLDILGVYISGNESAVQLVIMRGGKVTGSESFLLEGSEEESAGGCWRASSGNSM